jgi:hypothetical protein
VVRVPFRICGRVESRPSYASDAVLVEYELAVVGDGPAFSTHAQSSRNQYPMRRLSAFAHALKANSRRGSFGVSAEPYGVAVGAQVRYSLDR